LTRYETYLNVRYLLPIAALLILSFAVGFLILCARPFVRVVVLGFAFLLVLGSAFRTIDPVSRALWGTFPFGRHPLLALTSWNNECCGFSRDQLVYNLEYLQFDRIETLIFRDLRPNTTTTFVAHPE